MAYELICDDCKNFWVGNPYTEKECPNCGSTEVIVLRETN